MSTERRFNEEETAFILERAAAAESGGDDGVSILDSRAAAAADGLTISQLQEIAAEVGLSASAVAVAVQAVERGDRVPTTRRTAFGMPVGVSRTIEFSRPVTQAEWERMVVALRETFDARGKVSTEGTLRSWRNGNLQALLEPTAKGHRLRLITRRGDLPAMLTVGATLLVFATVMGIALAAKQPAVAQKVFFVPALFAVMGLAPIIGAFVRVPRWARTRASQMEAFATTAARILGESDRLAITERATARPTPSPGE